MSVEPRGTPDQRILVTGGAGFIGSHVVDAIVERKADVLVVDDLSSGRADNVNKRARLAQIEIGDWEALSRAAGEFEPTGVCHLAAQASVTASVRDPGFDMAVNVKGTLNVLEVARASAAPVVFASTGGALYGDEAPIPTTDPSPPNRSRPTAHRSWPPRPMLRPGRGYTAFQTSSCGSATCTGRARTPTAKPES